MSLRFGWCQTGHHASCRAEYGNADGIVRCDCPCHDTEAAA